MGSSFTDNSSKLKLKEDNYYFSEDGLVVFTEKYHKKRGYCCENKCKHCPYGFNK
jgi:hypothetical protein